MAGTILCCVNDSSHSRRAVEFAVEQAGGLGRELSFLVVNQTRPVAGYPPIRRWTDEEAQNIVSVAARYARTHGIKNIKRILFDSEDVASSILDCAREIDAGHIVVGTGNPPFLSRLLLGSVSEAIVSNATCSVTVAR